MRTKPSGDLPRAARCGDVRVVSVDDSSPDWRKETISFAAAYGGERVPAYFFTPKNTSPPFQTLVFCPTGFAVNTPSSEARELANVNVTEVCREPDEGSLSVAFTR